MKKLIGFCTHCVVILGLIVWGISSVDALELLVEDNDPSKIIVPNVKGISADLAVQILQISGLTGTIQRSGRNVTVVEQSPLPGALVASGSEIVLSLGGAATSEPESKIATIANGTGPIGIFNTPISSQKNQSQMTIMYAPQQSVHVKTPMAWYPKRFLSERQSTLSPPLLQRELSKDTKNIYNVKPLRVLPGDKLPIILAPTGGWQYGWIPSTSTIPSSQSLNTNSGASSQLSIQALPTNPGTGRQVMQLPSFVWMSLSDAKSALSNRGLALGTVTETEDSHMRSGLVYRQYPEASSIVSRGTSVSLWVVK